ncbi:MAG: hypothetical protein OJF49_003471 [Ktedonobacterales bacterium]|nr:MAG: hypothetical protein OJF49_003471 [Ktedonobacterales bacterium]
MLLNCRVIRVTVRYTTTAERRPQFAAPFGGALATTAS